MDGPDLFVVCKNCQAEVSPYITECPYCGHRLRKRAPKLEKGMGPSAPKPSRVPRRRASAPRPSKVSEPRFGGRSERPSWKGAGRPYATISIVVASIVLTLSFRAGLDVTGNLLMGVSQDPWAPATSAFIYIRTGYEVVALAAVFLFGWLLERRVGAWAVVLVFAVCGIGSLYLVDAIDPGFFYGGANGAALGLLGVWAARDITLRRRGEDPESDGLGAVVVAILLILLPVAAEEAHSLAGAAGGVAGLLIGFPLARIDR